MFFSAEDEGDQDFMSGGGGSSKLASLFGIDQASRQGGNESLTYTAPKQPKAKGADSNQQQAGAPALLFATVVHAYKYVDGKYASQGKLGAAILGNHTSLDYKILLYVSKTQQVTHAKISRTFSYTVQTNNYASFYDDQRQTWSVMFENEANATQFAKHVALSKANSGGSNLDALISQDLQLGDGGSLDTNDNVEVRYTGWLLSNHTFGKEFDSNAKSEKLFRFKIGKGKVIKGWDTGVIGMKKGSKRLLVVPPSLGYGSQGAGSRIPPNSTLIFEIEVMRVKLAKSDSPAPSPTPEPPPVMPSPTPETEGDSPTVKGRTKSITEHMSQGGADSNKAKLISRMARMGQPMLPLVGAVPAQPDSDEEGPVPESPQAEMPAVAKPAKIQQQPVINKPVPQHPQQPYVQQQQPFIQPQPLLQQPGVQMMQPPSQQPAFLQEIPAAQQLSVYQPQQNFLQQQQQAALLQQQQQMQGQPVGFQPASGFPGQPQPYGPGYPQQPNPYTGTSMAGTMPPMSQSGDISTPVLLTETRQQNTELRLSIGKMSDKIDRVMEKMDTLQSAQSGQLALHSSVPNMESAVLMHNIQRIVQENERLKNDLYEKSSKVEQQNQKISELLQSNQMFVEKSQNLLEQRNEGFKTSASQSQARVLQLEQEKVQLASELSQVTSQLSALQLEITDMRKKEIEVHRKLEGSSQDTKKYQDDLESLQTQHQEDEQRITELSQSLKEEKQRRKQMENRVSQWQEELTDLKSTNETLEKNLNERKRKAADERRKMEEEFEEHKSSLEEELQSLKDKLRRQKNSTDAVTAEQVSQVEADLNQEWKDKCDRMLNMAQEKHNRAIQSVREEKSELEEKIEQLEQKILTLKNASGSSDQRLQQVQEKLEEMSAYKEKYENLRSQASAMKEKYEEKISDLEDREEEASQEKDKALSEVRQLQQTIKETASSSSSGEQSLDRETLAVEIKKIMNSVYQQLRSEFEAEKTYNGTKVLGAILNAIKVTTLKLVQKQPPESKSDDDQDEDDDDDEEEEDDDDDEEEEEEDDEEESEEDEEEKEDIPDAKKEEVTPVKSEQKEVENSVKSPSQEVETKAEVKEAQEQKVQEADPPPDSKVEDQEKEESPQMENQSSGHTNGNVSENQSEVKEGEITQGPIDSSKHSSDQDSGNKNLTNQEAEVEESKNDSTNQEPEPSNDEKKTVETEKKNTSRFDDFEVPLSSSREPPPLTEDSEDLSDSNKDQDEMNHSPLFGDDDNIEDTFGETFKAAPVEKPQKPTKDEVLNDDDMKPKPPPPLFPDDDDDDDLDWLS